MDTLTLTLTLTLPVTIGELPDVSDESYFNYFTGDTASATAPVVVAAATAAAPAASVPHATETLPTKRKRAAVILLTWTLIAVST